MLQEQDLSNLLHRKDYVKAVGVAISLDQPYRVCKILQGESWLRTCTLLTCFHLELLENGGAGGNFAQIIRGLREDQLREFIAVVTRVMAIFFSIHFRFRSPVCQSLEPERTSQPRCPTCGGRGLAELPYRPAPQDGGHQARSGRAHSLYRETLPETVSFAAGRG